MDSCPRPSVSSSVLRYSLVSRMRFESDEDDIASKIKPERIKIKPDIYVDDEATRDLYYEPQEQQQQHSSSSEIIEISDEDETSDGNRNSKRSNEKQSKTQTKDAETNNTKTDTVDPSGVKNKLTEKRAPENENTAKIVHGKTDSGRNNNLNNRENTKDINNIEEIRESDSANTERDIIGIGNKYVSQSNMKTNKQKKAKLKKKKKTTSKTGKKYYRCRICSCYYTYYNALRKHLKSAHKIKKPPFDPSVPFERRCNFCQFKFKNTCTYNKHIKRKHASTYNKSNEMSANAADAPNTTFNVERLMNQFLPKKNKTKAPKLVSKKKKKDKVIPKSDLFQCNKCSTNFLSCKMAVNHAKECGNEEYINKQIIVACPTCHRNFFSQNIVNHYIQHKHTNAFTTHVLNENNINKYLYKCPNCQLCFNETRFRSHRIKKVCLYNRIYEYGITCNRCGLKISDECFLDHEQFHRDSKDATNFFVIVDVIIVNSN